MTSEIGWIILKRQKIYYVAIAITMILIMAACGSPRAVSGLTDTPTSEPPLAQPSTATGSSQNPSEVFISAEDQVLAGHITVTRASIDKPGWIEIHAAKVEGGFDAATDIGHLFIESGTHENVIVKVAEPLAESQTLYAMLHYDQPDDGQFTFAPSASDDPPVVFNGEVAVVPFEVSVAQEISASIEVSDQIVTGQVTIAEVTIEKLGWIEVHSENPEGGFDAASDLGHLPIEPGRHTNVVVPLQEALGEGQTLYAMLHYDEPADAQYTFAPGKAEDPPVVLDGKVVVKPFQAAVSSENRVKISLSSFKFDPEIIRVQPGETMQLLIQNQDEHVFHTFTVEGLEDVIDIPVGGGKTIQQEITVPLSTARAFVLYCRPHRGLGMVGEFAVEGP